MHPAPDVRREHVVSSIAVQTVPSYSQPPVITSGELNRSLKSRFRIEDAETSTRLLGSLGSCKLHSLTVTGVDHHLQSRIVAS